MLTFARYALDSVVRNRRRTLYAVLGITLAISLIAGSLIAVDSASIGLIRERLDAMPVDFYGTSYYFPYEIDVNRSELVRERLLTVDGVEDASYAVTTQGWRFLNTDGDVFSQDDYYYWYPNGAILALPDAPATIMERYRIEGEAPGPGTAAISKTMALTLGIGPGDEVVCSYESQIWDYNNGTYYIEYSNVSFEVSQIWDQDEGIEEMTEWWYWDYGGYLDPAKSGDVTMVRCRNPVIINMADLGALYDVANEYSPPSYSETFVVWIDREEFVVLGNIYLSLDLLDNLRGRLERASRDANMQFQTPLSRMLSDFGADMSQKKLLFVGLSLPVMVLGLYLSVVGVEMGMTERRREVGVLKSRGASNRQVMGSLIAESLVLGVIASLSGLGLGFLLSRFLVVAVTGLFGSSSASQGVMSFPVSWGTVGSVVLLGVSLMLLSSYRPMKRASRMPVSEALHHYTPKTVRVEYKSRYDIAALVLVGLSALSVLLLNDWIIEWRSTSMVLYFLVAVLVVMGVVIVPAVPFLLSASIIRLVTRGSRKLYTRFTWFVRPWTQELHYLVEKNIARNPKRASNIGMIVSLAVAFGLFVSVTMESELAYAERSVFYEVGADIRYTGYARQEGFGTPEIDFDLLATVDALEGVERSAMFLNVYVDTGPYFTQMAVIDSEDISAVLDIGSGWYGDDGSRDIRDLERNGTVFVSEYFARSQYITLGETLYIRTEVVKDALNYTNEFVDIELEVIGFLERLPGLSCDLYVDDGTMSFIDPSTYSVWGVTVGFFVTVEEGADHADTAGRLSSLCSLAGLDGGYVVAEQRLEDMTSVPEFRSIRSFLYLEYAMSLVMLTCGVGLVLFVTVWDRRQELACIMARGTSSEQMRRILMGESLSLMSLGMIVGVSVGLFSAFLYNMLAYGFESGTVPHGVVMSWISWAVVLSAIASFVVASFLATYNAGKLKLAEILRIRGG